MAGPLALRRFGAAASEFTRYRACASRSAATVVRYQFFSMLLGRLLRRYCLFTVFRLVDMSTNEGTHICRPQDTRESRIKHQLRHARRGLNLGFENVRLQRVKKALV